MINPDYQMKIYKILRNLLVPCCEYSDFTEKVFLPKHISQLITLMNPFQGTNPSLLKLSRNEGF